MQAPTKKEIADILIHLAKTRTAVVATTAMLVLLGNIGMLSSTPAWQNIGASLIASAIVALCTIWVDFIRNSEQLRAEELKNAGINRIHERRDLQEIYAPLVEKAEKIYVTGYSLNRFTESNFDKFESRIKNGEKLELRLLIVDPSTPFAKKMEEMEGASEGLYSARLSTTIKKASPLKTHIEIRTLTRPLNSMIYRLDDDIFTGPYPQKGSSSTATTLHVRRPGWLYDRLAQEFDEMWEEATRVMK